MMDCPFCEGFGFYEANAEGSSDADCWLCSGTGKVFSGMRKIVRRFFMPKYVIDCPSCGTENHCRNMACSECRYQFS